MKRYKFKDTKNDIFLNLHDNNSISINGELISTENIIEEFNGTLSPKGTKLLYETLKKRFETNDNPTDTPFEAGEVIIYDGMYACTISAEYEGIVQCVPLEDPDYIQEWKIFLDGKKCVRVSDSDMDNELREFQREVKICFCL